MAEERSGGGWAGEPRQKLAGGVSPRNSNTSYRAMEGRQHYLKTTS